MEKGNERTRGLQPALAEQELNGLFAAIDRKLEETERVIVAIDGSCASGKTTLAQLLHQAYGCSVFHMDDFFLQPRQRTPQRYAEPGGNVDRERFEEEVLAPLRAGETVRAARFDCCTMTLQPMAPAEPTRLSVVEGSYCLHPALRETYTLSVFLKIDPETQRQRIACRNGEDALQRFVNRWIPLEQAYHEACEPECFSDFVFENLTFFP